MEKSKLSPCPAPCGSTVIITEQTAAGNWVTTCEVCGRKGPIAGSADDADEDWNRMCDTAEKNPRVWLDKSPIRHNTIRLDMESFNPRVKYTDITQEILPMTNEIKMAINVTLKEGLPAGSTISVFFASLEYTDNNSSKKEDAGQ